MRCLACNKNLSDFESTRKYANSGLYVDLCNNCFGTITKEVPVIERRDLLHDSESTLEEAYENDYKFKDYDL